MTRPRLTIGYSTLAARAEQIRFPEPAVGTELLVVVQGGRCQMPERDDLRVVFLPSIGVARSRNEVLRVARGEVVLFGDDDVVWDGDGLESALTEMERDPGLALVMARAVDGSNTLRKRYDAERTRLNRWNSAKAATYELLVRRDLFADADVWFDEAFGAGVYNHLGDEYLLITDAVDAGLRCESLPVVIARHPSVSSGMLYGTDADTRSRAAVIARVFGRNAWLVRVLFWLRRPARFGSIRRTALFLFARFPSQPNGDTDRPTVPRND